MLKEAPPAEVSGKVPDKRNDGNYGVVSMVSPVGILIMTAPRTPSLNHHPRYDGISDRGIALTYVRNTVVILC